MSRILVPSAVLAVAVLAAAVMVSSCGGADERIEAVEAIPQPAAASDGTIGRSADSGSTRSPEPTRRGDEDVESILEFGLFGPVLPSAEGVIYESDCRFENDPYEACL